MHVLNAYAPTQVSVGTSSGELLAADSKLRTVMLTHVSGPDVWYCHKANAAELNKGFCLKEGGQITFDKDSIPLAGLNAIASSSAVVAIGKG